jgi:hypothetical protein
MWKMVECSKGIVAIVYSNGWRRQQLERSCVMNPRDDYAHGRDTVGNGSTMGDQRQKGIRELAQWWL